MNTQPSFQRTASRASLLIRIAALLFAFFMIVQGWCGDTNGSDEPLRIFFSKRVMLDLRDNDARAAVKAWTQMVFNQNDIHAEARTSIGSLAEVIAGFQNDTIDGASLPTDEFIALSEKVSTGFLYFPLNGTDPFEEYLLLVHSGSGITNLAGLRGHNLTVLRHHRMNLADIWLDTTLAKEGLPLKETYFETVRIETKGANVVLPVFFRKADACLITRRGFELMTELNPQVGNKLRVLLASPKLVPTMFCFNPRANSVYLTGARATILDLHRTVFGQQILTTFQIDRLAEGSAEWLESARTLMKEHAQWCGNNGDAKPVPVAAAPPLAKP